MWVAKNFPVSWILFWVAQAEKPVETEMLKYTDEVMHATIITSIPLLS